MKLRAIAQTVLLGLSVSSPALVAAQDIDKAIQAYNDDKYDEAAFLFFDVVENGDDPDARVKAEYYIAQSLNKSGYYLPAMQYYGDVFNSGPPHPYFLKATEGLLKVSAQIGDDTLIPELINKGYSEDFRRLKAPDLNQINYMIGMISHRRADYAEAKGFLEAVDEKSTLYVKARYLLAIMAVKTSVEEQSGDYSEALKHFDELEKRLAGKTGDEEKRLYRMSLLGQARAQFSQGNWPKSVENYERVTRFSEEWYDSMFESGWAYFQNQEFGKALGMVHSIQSPYFDDRYRAESWVLKATVYFQMCHLDRSRKALEVFFDLYEPMAEKLKPYLEEDLTDEEMVDLMAKGAKDFPEEIRGQILANKRFQRFNHVGEEVRQELAKAEKELPEGTFKAYLLELLKDQLEQRTALTAKLIRARIQRESIFLEDFLNQGRIIKFETADLERRILELGKDITKGPRAKGPRPHVPSSRFQYWDFMGEYWIDELGFYEHSIKDECIPQLFE